jgi:phospholipid transport system transporter-binding protein
VSEVEQVLNAAPGQVTVSGALSFQTARRVSEAGLACFERDPSPVIVIDFAAVTSADSAGLAVLIEWRRWARQRQRHVRFANLPEQISAIAHLSEVTAVLADSAA